MSGVMWIGVEWSFRGEKGWWSRMGQVLVPRVVKARDDLDINRDTGDWKGEGYYWKYFL